MGEITVVKRASLASACAVALLSAGTAWAIPNQHLNPHSDAPADISWQNVAGVPNTTNHLHLKLRGGEAITQGATKISSNQGWQADSVWDDRFFRFADANNDQDNDDAAKFGHGYIDPTFTPLYTFNNVPNAAKTVLASTFTSWNTAAQTAATGVGNQTPAGTATTTSIKFGEAPTSGEAQFQFLFAPNVQSTQGAFAEWIASSAQDNPGGPALTALTMVYEQAPTNSVFAPAGFNIRDKAVGGAFGDTITQTVSWDFDPSDAPDDVANIDLEYERISDGMVFDTLTGVMGAPATMDTNTFDTVTTGDTVFFWEMDFLTIALHETGHVLGLLHDPTSAAGAAANIMRSQIAFNAGFGSTMQTIDANSGYGAAALYTIPVPEPTALAAIVLGLGCVARRRRNS